MFVYNEQISWSSLVRSVVHVHDFFKYWKIKKSSQSKKTWAGTGPLIFKHKVCNEKYRKWMMRNGGSLGHDPLQILLKLLLHGTPSMLLASARFYYSLFVRPAQMRNVILWAPDGGRTAVAAVAARHLIISF